MRMISKSQRRVGYACSRKIGNIRSEIRFGASHRNIRENVISSESAWSLNFTFFISQSEFSAIFRVVHF